MPPSRPQLVSSGTIPVPPMSDDLPEDVKKSLRDEMYQKIYVLFNKDGSNVCSDLKFMFLIALGLAAESGISIKYPSFMGIPRTD